MIDKIFANIDKLTDILNLGRLIFYTGAGLFPVTMLFAFISLLSEAELKATVFAQFGADLPAIEAHPFWAVYLSMLAGFVINVAVYPLVIGPLNAEISRDPRVRLPDDHAFPYLYPRLRNNPETDHQGWLVAEYWRYIEISTMLPVGGGIALLCAVGYSFFFLFRQAANGGTLGFEMNHAAPIAGMALFALLYGAVWPWWTRTIVKPVVFAYQRAKHLLSAGVEDFKDEALRSRKAE